MLGAMKRSRIADHLSFIAVRALLITLSLLISTFVFAAGREVTTPVYGPNGGAWSPVVASNGETFLTVWYEDSEIRGSLADRSGRVITPVSFPILPLDFSVIGAFDVAAIGTNYVIAFSTEKGFQLAQLSGTGALLKITKVDAPFRGYEAPRARVASNGSSILIVAPASKGFPQTETVAYLLDREGVILRSTSLGKSQSSSNVIVQGDQYVVAVAAAPSIVAQRIAANGALVRSSTIGSVATLIADIALAAHGDEVLVMWSESSDVRGAHAALLLRDGRVGSGRALPVGPLGLRRSVALAATASGYMAALSLCAVPNSSDCGAYLLRLDERGVPLDGAPFRVSATFPTSIEAIGPTLLLVTVSSRVENHVVDPLTMAVASSTVSISAPIQREPSLASNGVDFFASFIEKTLDRSPLKGARFNREGAPLDGPGLLIGADDTGSIFSATAYGGSTYVVVWIDAITSTLYARRFDAMGHAIDAGPLVVGPADAVSPPAVAWNGQNFLAVWPHSGGIDGALLSARGNSAGAPIPLAPRGSNVYFANPDVASDGNQFLITWGVYPFFCDPCAATAFEVRATGADASGLPFDGKPIVVAAATRGRVASSGGEFLIAVDTVPRMNEGPRVWGVSTATAHAEGRTLRIAAPRLLFPWPSSTRSDVVWDGSDYVIAWRYQALSTAFLGSMRVTRSGFAFDRRAVVTGRPTTPTYYLDSTADPAIAANTLGDVAIVTSESSRLQAYFVSEMSALPQLPRPPENVRASLSGARLTMWWDTPPGDVNQYTFEMIGRLGTIDPIGQVQAPTNSYTLNVFLSGPTPLPLWMRARAWNAAGSSEPSAWVQVPATRSRSIRR